MSEFWRTSAVGKLPNWKQTVGMKLPSGLPLQQEGWEQTPLSVQAVVVALWQGNQVLKQQVTVLKKQVDCLEAEVTKLREQVNRIVVSKPVTKARN